MFFCPWRHNPFRVASVTYPFPQGSAEARNPGLKFTNAFGVRSTWKMKTVEL